MTFRVTIFPMMEAQKKIAACIATWFGAGLMPKGPGTAGSLAALPFAWYLWQMPTILAWSSFAVFCGLAVWAAGAFDADTGKHDNQKIVVDEVVGIFLTTAVARHTVLDFALAFALFRVFDIWKPWPVRYFDRHVQGGLGVVIDDFAAALYAALTLVLLRFVVTP